MVVSVGIDVSKDKHDCFILNSEGEVLADVFTTQQHGWFYLPASENPELHHIPGQNKSRA